MHQQQKDTHMMNDYILDQYCADMARDIYYVAVTYSGYDDVESIGDYARDHVYEWVDDIEYVIYYHKAHEVCQNCNTDNGEDYINDIGMTPKSYNEFAVALAYGEIMSRVQSALEEIIDEAEASEAA